MGQSQLTLEDAADVLGWSGVQLRRLIRSGELRVGSSRDTVLWEDVQRLSCRSLRLTSLITDEELAGTEPPGWLRSDCSPMYSTDEFVIDRIVQGSCLDWLRRMPDHCVQAIITSPPYWGVRRYADDQTTVWADGSRVAFGQEKWPEDYVRHTLEILRELRRVVRRDGIVWWNVGDTYMTRSHVRADSGERLDALEGRRGKESWRDYPVRRYSAGHPYLKDKDLTLVPFQIALGAQRLGWWARSVITWSKANTLPEPVKDRPTTSHEYILMLTQTRFYKYNEEAATEAAQSDWYLRDATTGRRNLRTVWNFGTSVGHGNHVAAFPLELPLRCIEASTDAGDLVFDPFAGSGTTLLAAKMLGRRYFGCDISPTYIAEATARLQSAVSPINTSGLDTAGANGRSHHEESGASQIVQGRLLESSDKVYQPD